jgi:hypothetical protein
MVDKPQYFLVLKNGTVSVDHFRSADPKLQKNEAILWNRTSQRPDLYLLNNIDDAVPLLKSNPFAVFYGQEMMVHLRVEDYPCTIIATSKTLRKVIFECDHLNMFLKLTYFKKVVSVCCDKIDPLISFTS